MFSLPFGLFGLPLPPLPPQSVVNVFSRGSSDGAPLPAHFRCSAAVRPVQKTFVGSRKQGGVAEEEKKKPKKRGNMCEKTPENESSPKTCQKTISLERFLGGTVLTLPAAGEALGGPPAVLRSHLIRPPPRPASRSPPEAKILKIDLEKLPQLTRIGGISGGFRAAKSVDSAAQPPKVLYPPRRYIGTATREPDSAGLRYWEDMQN